MSNIIPSKKVTGNERLEYSFMYLCNQRTKELLKEIDLISVNDYYERGVIEMLCDGNPPTNMSYIRYMKYYDKRLWVFLKNTSEERLKELFKDCLENTNSFGRKIVTVLRNIYASTDRSHYLLALWNKGLKLDKECMEHIPNSKLKVILLELNDVEFTFGERYKLLNKKCPITLDFIEEPAILPDGTVYEYQVICDWLQKHDTDPLTNLLLNRSYYNGILSNKILFLPKKNSFETFELINN
eukprot:TRINITY_DN2572_c0_g1_i1.p1 TRINITY_DN2572_c0_g1~~TRINITY_DN2572_c0_g1_i1.p1  ORF type:complete len:241 (-),score=45.10 TRINITY_DN2572_c0_g1_i1:7-729(-)